MKLFPKTIPIDNSIHVKTRTTIFLWVNCFSNPRKRSTNEDMMIEGRIGIYLCILFMLWSPELVMPWNFQSIAEIFRKSRERAGFYTEVNSTCPTAKVNTNSIFARADCRLSRPINHVVERSSILSFASLSRLAASVMVKLKAYNTMLKGLVSKTWVKMKTFVSTKPNTPVPEVSPNPAETLSKPTGTITPETPLYSDNNNTTPVLNDRFEMNVDLLPLTKEQHHQLFTIYHNLQESLLSNSTLLAQATATHFPITPHVVYRYLAGNEWRTQYMGRS